MLATNVSDDPYLAEAMRLHRIDDLPQFLIDRLLRR
jgi:hypothetical protein